MSRSELIAKINEARAYGEVPYWLAHHLAKMDSTECYQHEDRRGQRRRRVLGVWCENEHRNSVSFLS